MDLRTKACRAAASQELDKNNAEKIEFLAKQLNMAYLKIDDKKLQFEGSLYLKSLSKKIKDVIGRDPREIFCDSRRKFIQNRFKSDSIQDFFFF